MEAAFLICSERCGSNLIRAILDAHSEIYAPRAMHLGRDIGCRLHEFGDLRDDENWQRLVMAVKESAELLYERDRHSLRRVRKRLSRAEPGERDYRTILEAAHHPGMEASGARLLFLKENHIHRQAFFLLRHYPQAKFVFQVRDPRDYLLSVKERKAGFLGSKYGSTLRALDIWKDDQLGGLRLLSHLGRDQVFVQRYEDLVASPQSVLEPLCRFLGVSFEEAMLRFNERDAVQTLAQPGTPWENLAKPIMATNTGRFRDGLSALETRVVEQYLGSFMHLFGYERAFAPASMKAEAYMRAVLPVLADPIERIANGQLDPLLPRGDVALTEQFVEDGVSIPLSYGNGSLPGNGSLAQVPDEEEGGHGVVDAPARARTRR